MNEIIVSVIIQSRERVKKLRRSLLSLDIFSYCPEKIEYLVWVDEDDKPTIEYMKKLKIEMQNLRFFVCPRVGFYNWWFVFKNLTELAKGEIILPWADDYYMINTYWDKRLNEFSEEEAFIGWKTRFAFTRLLMKNHDIPELYHKHHQKANEKMWGYGYERDLFKTFGRSLFEVEIAKRIHRIRSYDKGIPENFDILAYEK